jgi:hypothetical protein
MGPVDDDHFESAPWPAYSTTIEARHYLVAIHFLREEGKCKIS